MSMLELRLMGKTEKYSISYMLNISMIYLTHFFEYFDLHKIKLSMFKHHALRGDIFE